MLVKLLLIIVIIVIIVLLLYIIYWWHYCIINSNSTDDIIPTLHAKCNKTRCGGELVCDQTSSRCRQILDHPCADDVDCVHGLHCINWICTNKSINSKIEVKPELPQLTPKPSTIKWADEYK